MTANFPARDSQSKPQPIEQIALQPNPVDLVRRGPLLRAVVRAPIGAGDDGKIYAVAVSPDGKLVAAGGWDPNLYLFDAVTGAVKARIRAWPLAAIADEVIE
jgi:WD40 repeat protein